MIGRQSSLVVTAFLEADIKEGIHMRQPEGSRHTDIN
jgi:hypothetical protein